MSFKSLSGKLSLENGTKVRYNFLPGFDTKLVGWLYAGEGYKSLEPFKQFMPNTDLSVLKGTGKIVGIQSELPGLGFMYIIETDSKISEEYPYTSFVCPESYLEKV